MVLALFQIIMILLKTRKLGAEKTGFNTLSPFSSARFLQPAFFSPIKELLPETSNRYVLPPAEFQADCNYSG